MEDEIEITEYEKCRNNPYYFMTTYYRIEGKPFTTRLTEKEFNEQFEYLQQIQQR